jgi:hypothetical protein
MTFSVQIGTSRISQRTSGFFAAQRVAAAFVSNAQSTVCEYRPEAVRTSINQTRMSASISNIPNMARLAPSVNGLTATLQATLLL